MKYFNPNEWRKIKASTLAAVPSGKRLRLNLIDRAALWIVDGKTETLCGFSDAFDLKLPKNGLQFKIMAEGFVHDPEHKPYKNEAPTLTNLEKRAELSPAEIMVTKALRSMKLREREFEKKQREANAEQIAKQKEAEVVVEPVEPVVEPVEPVEPLADETKN